MALSTQEQLLLAAQVGARAHASHKRKDGTPYFAHPVRVSFRVASAFEGKINEGTVELVEEAQVAALLHDTVEDTSVTLDELRELGFSSRVVEAVDRLSRRSGETYMDFIDRCKKHDIARLVKIADIHDNLADQSALDPEEAEFLRNRYERALDVLG